MKNVNSQVITAIKWSSIAEVISKLITPLINMILARILTPSDFGIVASITVIISFAELFSDSGFQKFIIQYKFFSEKKLLEFSNVAFSYNIIISLLLWFCILICSNQLAIFLGNNDINIAIVIAALNLPLTAFSSIQMAIYKKQLNYKILFFVRVISAMIPLIITVPLAFFQYKYWALIIGNLIANISSSVAISILSEYKLKLNFDINILRQMWKFSVWSLYESFGTWVSTYIDTFIVGYILDEYYLGLYKTTIVSVNGIFSIITVATTSILFSVLSKLQDDKEKYDKIYLIFIKGVSIFIIPLGFGIFLYKDIITNILLGEQWLEATTFVGFYGLFSGFCLVYGQYASEYYRGLGKPKISVLTSFIHIIFLVPIIYSCSKDGFDSLVYGRVLLKVIQILIYLLLLKVIFNFKVLNLFSETKNIIISSILMYIVGSCFIYLINSLIFKYFSVVLCIIVYFFIYLFLLNGKKEMFDFFQFLKKNRQN